MLKSALQVASLAGLAVLMAAPVSTYAASITWEAPKSTVDATDVVLSGTTIAAVDVGGTSNVTVNGVTFAAGNPFTGAVDNVVPTMPAGAYHDLLDTLGFDYPSTGAALQLTGLNLNANYLIQLWFSQQGFDYNMPVGTVGLNAAGDNTFGQYVVGRFKADATTQTINIGPSSLANAALNAYQVRTSLVPVPAPLALIAIGALGLLRSKRR